MAEKPEKFKKCVQKCLRYHVLAINKLVEDGMIFWEYGNGFQSEANRAGNYILRSLSHCLLINFNFSFIFLHIKTCV